MKQIYFKLLILVFGLNLGFSQTEKMDIIKDYLLDSGISTKDINSLSIQSESFSKSMNVSTTYVIQQYKGIPIKNAIGSFAIKNGKVVSFQGNYVKDISDKINTVTPLLSAEDAVVYAARILGLEGLKDVRILQKKSSEENSFVVTRSNISMDEIPVNLVYELKEERLFLCWDLSIHTKDGKNWYSIRLNAEDGNLLSQNDWIVKCSFNTHVHNENLITGSNSLLESELQVPVVLPMDTPVYNVFPIPSVESPNHGDRQLISGQEDDNASPFGWHDTDGVEGAEFNTTRGNNVIASEDFDGNDGIGYMPDGGGGLIFDYPYLDGALVADNEDASITNLFYANNVVHDVWYQYGFDETSGNFQFNNYGKGGFGGDEVSADAIDGSGTNNATFGTPPDGANPKMSMFLWNPQASSDVQVFNVNNTSLSGGYPVSDNSFDPGHVDAPSAPDAITADLALAVDDDATIDENDICSELINSSDLDGKIAVVRRGECNFTDKVFRCQQAGALAVLVVNNVGGDPIPMGGENNAITIPAVMINMTDGEDIINAIKSSLIPVNVSLSDAGKNIIAEDGSFDNGIVIHEYGHGISNRLAGGPSAAGCLGNAEQMGEGWSDWFALMMTIESGDNGTDSRGIGTYATGQPTSGAGIRPFPYSTDMNVNPVTYDNVKDDQDFSQPHGIGSIWASILWDMTWAFIERDGFDPDLYNGTGGNNLAMQLVIDGLKLQACNPGFVSGRDGILAAAELLPNNEANKCVIWDVFARRGVGYGALEGSTDDRFDQIAAFNLPPSSELDCSTLSVDSFNESIFKIEPNPSRGIFNIRVSESLGDSNIYIFDMNGRIVYKERVSLTNLYRVETGLRSGIYLLRIEAENGEGISTSKIIIE
ncbi:T9SS-dependent M36 family metallopeptidase [Aquimarina latercula]|uniref:T9SS-dependent M36 family metallopeptidase n=1 Tax=Aquimarina latercula TaxID=987 RepID=UPI00048775EB|nr:T9SS-dependent M36 family metallopeptidase [Aquimarina latercula]